MEAAFIMIIDWIRLMVEAVWGFVATSMAEQLSVNACTSAMKDTHSAEESIDSSDKCMGLDDPPSRPFSLKHDILDKDKREKTQRLINKVVSRRASAEKKSEKAFHPGFETKSFTCRYDCQTIECDGYCQIHRPPLHTSNEEVERLISEPVTVTLDGGPKTTEGRNLQGESKGVNGGASVIDKGPLFQSNVTQNRKEPLKIDAWSVLLFLLVCVLLAERVYGNPTHPITSSESGTSDEDSCPSIGEEIPLHLGNQITDIIETAQVDDREGHVQHIHNSAEPDSGNPAGEPNLNDHMNGENFVSYQPTEDPDNRECFDPRLRQETNLVCQRPASPIPSASSLDIASEQCRGARHGQFTTMERRHSSFQKWPTAKKNQSPRQLAAAGFYYEGTSNITTCFCCGVRLTQWEPDDDPLMEHIRANPECEYVRQIEQNRVVPERPTDFQHEAFLGPTNNSHGQRYRGHDGRTVNQQQQQQRHGVLRHTDQNNDHQHPTLTASSVAVDFVTMGSSALCPNQQRASQTQGVLDTPTNRDGKSTVLRDTESEARQERHGSHNGDSLRRNLTTPSHGLPRDAEAGAERRPGHRQIHPQQESNYRDNTCSGWCPESAIASPDRTMTEEIDVSTRAESRPGHRQIHPQQEMNYLNITHSDWCPESALDVPNLPMPEEIDVSTRAESRPGHRQIHPQQERNYLNITHADRCPESALDVPNLPMPEEIDVSTRAESRPGHRQIHPQQERNYLNITHSDRCPESAIDVPNLPMPEEIYVSRRDFNTQDERESSTTSSSTLDDEERQALLEQNKRLKECLYCKICLMREAQCLIIPCGHLMCVVCFIRVRNCPFCRGCARAFLCIRRC